VTARKKGKKLAGKKLVKVARYRSWLHVIQRKEKKDLDGGIHH